MSRKKTNKVEAETGEVVQSNRPFIIRNGGIAKPLGQGLYLLGGKTHEQGGIDIDFTGDARIFSAQPILNGNSPAELVARGANPNITFNRQERFKDVNRINDDGSRKAKCGKRVKAEIGTETKQEVPTREEYITSKIDSTINNSLRRSLNKTVPDLVYVPITESNYSSANAEIEFEKNNISKFSVEAAKAANNGDYDSYYRYMNDAQISSARLNRLKSLWDKGLCEGPNCIYNATKNYGDEYATTGNYTYMENHNKKGFVKIDSSSKRPGDITQVVNDWNNAPSHAMTYYRTDENGVDRFNYSNGNSNKQAIRKDAKYPVGKGIRLDYYRFVGTPADSVRWTNEYNKLYMNNSNKKRLGGSTGLIRVQANGKDRLMYVPFTGEETKASRKKAQYGEEVIITAPNKRREEFLPIVSSIDYPDSLSIVPPYIRTPYSIKTKTPADLKRDMKIQMIGREFSNDTTSNYLDKVRFNEAYVPYDGEMATVTPSTSVVPDSIENPIERINGGWQSEYKPIVANNTIKEVNGVVNTSWLPKRNNISVNIPKINAYDPRISMIGRTFANDNKASKPNKIVIPKFNTPTINGVSSSSSDLPSEIILNQNVQNVIDRNIATDGYNEFMGYNKYNVPEITDKQVRQQTRAALKKEGLDWVSRNKDWAAPTISALGNIGASLISYGINKGMLGDLDYSTTPVAKRAAKLKTNININPELTALGETLSRTIDATNANTASSRVANARNQASMLNTTLTANKLYADKENRETALINQDRLNQQEVANANIDAYNNWKTGKTNFENTIREQLSENAVSLVDNINKGIQTGITDAEKRRQFRNSLAVMAAAYPNVTPELLHSYGFDVRLPKGRYGGKVKLNKKK